MAQITWRNVDAPNMGGTAQLLQGARQSLNSAGQAATNVLTGVINRRTNEFSQDQNNSLTSAQAELSRLTSSGDVREFVQGGGLEQMAQQSNLSADSFNRLRSYSDSLVNSLDQQEQDVVNRGYREEDRGFIQEDRGIAADDRAFNRAMAEQRNARESQQLRLDMDRASRQERSDALLRSAGQYLTGTTAGDVEKNTSADYGNILKEFGILGEGGQADPAKMAALEPERKVALKEALEGLTAIPTQNERMNTATQRFAADNPSASWEDVIRFQKLWTDTDELSNQASPQDVRIMDTRIATLDKNYSDNLYVRQEKDGGRQAVLDYAATEAARRYAEGDDKGRPFNKGTMGKVLDGLADNFTIGGEPIPITKPMMDAVLSYASDNNWAIGEHDVKKILKDQVPASRWKADREGYVKYQNELSDIRSRYNPQASIGNTAAAAMGLVDILKRSPTLPTGSTATNKTPVQIFSDMAQQSNDSTQGRSFVDTLNSLLPPAPPQDVFQRPNDGTQGRRLINSLNSLLPPAPPLP